jgi:hypothetical protein
MATLKDLRKAYPEYEMIDEDEEDRLEHIRLYGLSCLDSLCAANMPTVSKQKEKGHQRRRGLQRVRAIACVTHQHANLLTQNPKKRRRESLRRADCKITKRICILYRTGVGLLASERACYTE